MRIISKNYIDYSYMESLETMNILSFYGKHIFLFFFVWFYWYVYFIYQASLNLKKKSYNNFNELEKKPDIICTWDLLSY